MKPFSFYHWLSVFLCLPLAGHAQHNGSTLACRYSITPEQALQLVHCTAEQAKEPERPCDSWQALAAILSGQIPTDTLLNTPLLFGTTPAAAADQPGQAVGWYVVAAVAGDSLLMQVYSVSNLSVFVRDNSRALEVVVYDERVQPVSQAQVWLGDRPLRYWPDTRSYWLPRCRAGGLLRVEARGEMILQEVKEISVWSFSKRRRVHRKARMMQHPVGRVVYKSSFRLKNAVAAPFSSRARWALQNMRDSDLRQRMRQKGLYGYVLFSKPRYLPGDTLRVTAYAANRKGKPRSGPVRFYVQGNGKKYFKTVLKPWKMGHFLVEKPLKDTLVLDKDYYVVLYEPRKIKRRLRKAGFHAEDFRTLKGEFRYEDYQLNSVTYNMSTQPAYASADSAWIALNATDSNGEHVPAIRAQLTATVTSVGALRDTAVWIPDTLWHAQTLLREDGETRIAIPPAAWPAADVYVRVSGDFFNHAGEMQHQELSFWVRSTHPLTQGQPQPILQCFAAQDNLLEGKWLYPDVTTPDTALLHYWHYGNRQSVRHLRLPFKDTLPPDVWKAELRSGAQTSVYRHTPSRAFARFTTKSDTVMLLLDNPAREYIRYTLWEDGRVLMDGSTGDSVWVWSAFRPQHQYRFCYTVHNKEAQEERYQCNSYHFTPHALRVHVHAPAQVKPGAVGQVRIAVEDSRGRRVPDVHLSAAGINARFGADELPFTAPLVKGGIWRTSFANGHFKTTPLTASRTKRGVSISKMHPDSSKGWYKRLSLDTILYYQLRHEPNADRAFLHCRPFYQQEQTDTAAFPQFSPFVVKNGEQQTVHLIFCNKQLCYSSAVSTPPPYSFYGMEGSNEIVLRTASAQYTLQKVSLRKGEKCHFSIEERPDSFAWRVRAGDQEWPIVRKPCPDTLDSFERQILGQSLLLWQPLPHQKGEHLFWQGPRRVQWAGNTRNDLQVVGPFSKTEDLISFFRPGDFFTQFQFEPGFRYELIPGRERLYADDAWDGYVKKLPKTVRGQHPGQLALRLSDLIPMKKTREYEAKIRAFVPVGKDQSGKAALQVQTTLPRDTVIKAILLRTALYAGKTGATSGAFSFKDTIFGPFNPSVRRWEGLIPGLYDLYFYTPDDYVAQVAVLLKKDTTLCIQLGRLSFQKADTGKRLGDRIRLDSVEVIRKTGEWSRFSQHIYLPGSTLLTGRVSDGGEALIGASVKVLQNGIFIKGGITDVDGRFQITVLPGIYDVDIAYTGYATQRITGMVLRRHLREEMEIVMSATTLLKEVLILGHAVPLVERDMVLAGSTLSEVTTYRTTLEPAYLYDRFEETDADSPKDKKPDDPTAGMAPEPVAVRRRFDDSAYWQPGLLTDQNGEAAFSVHFPDDITAWRSVALGMDRRRRGGAGTGLTRTFMPLSAQLALPRFAVAGDRFEAGGLAQHRGADSVRVQTAFFQNDRLLQQNLAFLRNARTEYASVEVPADADSVRLRYEIRAPQEADAEERSIAILRAGTERVEGDFWIIERDTEWVFTPKAGQGPVTLRVLKSGFEVLAEDLRYLAGYPYGCNEQTASRLIALLLAQKIGRQWPARAFPRAEEAVALCLKRLEAAQNADGSWGWWAKDRTEHWMTLYVLRALCFAQQEGHSTEALHRGLVWVRGQLDGFRLSDRTAALSLLRSCGVAVECVPYLKNARPGKGATLNDRLAWIQLLQLCGQATAQDSLLTLLTPTQTGALFCGTENNDWYDRRAMNTLLAYDIAVAAGWDDIAKRIRRYWWQSRTILRRNTIETAQIVLRLLPHVSTGEKGTLWVNHASGITTDADLRFPDNAPLHLQAKGGSFWAISATQRRFDPDPPPVSNHFSIQSAFFQRGQPCKTGILQRAEAAVMEIRVAVAAASEYVMLEVPIPAGCTYLDKNVSSASAVTHTEFFRDRAVLFFRSLPTGTHTFKISLQPRFTGNFTRNPARMEQMYFPVFYGCNRLEKVEIKSN